MTELQSDSTAVDFYTDPLPGMALHRLLDSFREQAPVVPVSFLGTPAWLITRQTELEAAFKDTDSLPPHRAYLSGIAPLIGENFQSMEGDRHRLFRKLATPTFRPRQIEKMDFNMLAEVADELIDTFIKDGEADLVSQFTERYPYIVIARLLGIPRDAEAQFADWVVAILNFSVDQERAFKCRDELWAYLDPVIEERISKPKEDVISQLIHEEVDGVRMNMAELKSHIGIMFSAGSSTTHDSIGNLVYGLLNTKDYWQQVRDNPDLRDHAIEEGLRWEPAVSFLPRISKEHESINIGGVEIQPDSLVLMGIAAANHDPVLYQNPHDFDLFRDSPNKMTFGHGPRTCPGMHLARKELRVTLDHLLERLPNLELLEPEKSAPSGTVFRNPKQLKCRF